MRIVAAMALCASVVVPCLHADEAHVERVVGEILGNVKKLKVADPQAVPMAFWDMDGTIIRGDCTLGLVEEGVERYKGFMQEAILAGLCPVYHGEEGCTRYRDVDYPLIDGFGHWLGGPFNAQVFHGQRVAGIKAFAQEYTKRILRNWFFKSSIDILRRLECAGVENHIVSANVQIFVEPVADFLGVDASRVNAIRVGIDGGRITTRIESIVPYGEGKVSVLRDVVTSTPHGFAIAAFGNSYSTDGAFLRHVATQASLPGGARGTAVMINGGKRMSGYSEHFICVDQSVIMGSDGVPGR